MILHEHKKLFMEAIRYTAQRKGVKEIYIEKDYWMCYILKILFADQNLNIGFKGGTALSKCYSYIQRFSEDIDICLLAKNNESDNQLNKRLRNITALIGSHFSEIEINGITQKIGTRRKIAYEYPQSFKDDFGQVRRQIIVEATHFGVFEPYEEKEIQSYIAEMMINTSQADLVEKFELEPFNVLVLSPHKTLCEKIMSLVRFSYSKNPVDDLNSKIRHIYDIYQLLGYAEINDFFESKDFDVILKSVADEDMISFKNNNAWLSHHPKDALIFSDKDIWSKLTTTYKTSFSTLVYGDMPDEKKMIDILQRISGRLEMISWDVDK